MHPASDWQGENQKIKQYVDDMARPLLPALEMGGQGRRLVGQSPDDPHQRQSQHSDANGLVRIDHRTDRFFAKGFGQVRKREIGDHQSHFLASAFFVGVGVKVAAFRGKADAPILEKQGQGPEMAPMEAPE